jgi:hypothetical protein
MKQVFTLLSSILLSFSSLIADTDLNAPPEEGAIVLFDGKASTLHQMWEYWEGPAFKSSMPIKWKVIDDPANSGDKVFMSHDPNTKKKEYGTSDIVTKKKFKDFRLHIEFLIDNPGGNSGVYLQNRFEIQVLDGDKTKHGMAAVINNTESPYHLYRGLKQWNAYDIVFRAARFKNGKMVEKPLVTVYFNGIKAHTNIEIQKVWGGPKSGLDGGNNKGFGITDLPGGIKLQNEGHRVCYKNIWIKELHLTKADTDF